MMETAPRSNSLLAKFVKEVSYTGTGVGFTMVLSTINMMILARYLPRYEYGIFLLLMILTDFLGMLSAFGLNTSIIPSLASAAEEDKSAIANSVITFRFLTFIAISVVFFLGQRWFLLLFGETNIAGLAVFVPFLLATQGYRNLLRSTLQGFFYFKRMVIIDVITSVLNLTMIVLFVIVLRASFRGLILAQTASQGFACVAFYWAIPGPKRLQFDRAHLTKIIHFGWPLQVNDVLNFIFSNMGSLTVAAFLGPAEVALLSVAGKVPTMIYKLYESFRSVYLPNLTKLLADGDQRRAHQLLNTSLRLTSFVTALGALVAAIWSREIITLLFSQQYLPSATAFVLLMAAVNISLVGNVLGTSLVGAGDSKGPVIANIVTAGVNLLTNLTLIPVLGVNGAALASSAGSLVANPVNVWLLRRRKIWPNVMAYLKPLLVFAAFWALAAYLQPFSWVYRTLLLPLFFVACYLLSVFTVQDIQSIGPIFLNRFLRLVRPDTPYPKIAS